jgi:hypothetical protein
MEPCELEIFRLKLWDRFITLRTIYDITITFDQFWYEFLAKHISSETPIPKSYVEACKAFEQSCEFYPKK